MTTTVKTFADFDVDPLICKALDQLGITTPFPIQELTLPLALSNADLIGQARTGTGKTLAFGIPILQKVATDRNATQALVIVPTRELCLQVHDDLTAAGAKRGVTAVAAYGGRAIDPQSEAIAGGAEVVVGTPGRLLDLMRRGLLNLSTVSTLVLDEADEMLDMGFLPDVEQLIEACATDRQTMLFSATMPSEVVALARRYMSKPTFMRADVEESRVAPDTRQHFFAVHRMDKPALVTRILATEERGRSVIFTRTKRMADMLVKDLRDAGLNAAAIHSDLRQEAREKTLARFRSGKIDIMCATEVAARGLDIDEVTHVINYDCPDDEKMYLHRIGRTGRAGARGVAVTLAIWNELARLDMIKKALDISEPTLEAFSTSDVLDELFPKPPSAKSGYPDVDGAPAAEANASDTVASDAAAPSRRRRSGAAPKSDRRPTSQSKRGPRPADARPSPDHSDQVLSRRRVRRRERPSEDPAQTTTGANEQQPASPPAAGAGGDSAPAPTPRTRRRRSAVTPADSATAEGRAGQQPTAPAHDAPRPSADAPAPSARQAERDAAPPQGSKGRQSKRGGRRSRRDRDGRGQRSPSTGRHTDRTEADDHAREKASDATGPARQSPTRPDATTARGSGSPRLRRPFRITHLP